MFDGEILKKIFLEKKIGTQKSFGQKRVQDRVQDRVLYRVQKSPRQSPKQSQRESWA